MIELEVCANSVASCIAARTGGAHRIELCAGLPEGGLTPSYGYTEIALNHCDLPIFPIIRPRGGDFLYDEYELDQMQYDIEYFYELGVAGFVFGALTRGGELDLAANARLIEAADGKPCTLHRAFDMVRDPLKSLDEAVRLGFSRILTSGGAATALEGVDVLKELVRAAGDRITIMAGSGVRPENALEIVTKSGVPALHGTLQTAYDSDMIYRNGRISLGGSDGESEYLMKVTDARKVRALLEQFR